MEKYLKSLELLFIKFKKNPNQQVSIDLDGESIPGINLLYTSLYCVNNKLDGSYTQFENCKAKEVIICPEIKSIPHITYEYNLSTYIFPEDYQSKDLDSIKQQLQEHRIVGFSYNINEKLIELPIPNISYKKKEIIPNEYIGLPSLNPENKITKYEQKKYTDTEEILTDYYLAMYLNHSANMKYLSKISLDNILAKTEKAYTNAIKIIESQNKIKQKL